MAATTASSLGPSTTPRTTVVRGQPMLQREPYQAILTAHWSVQRVRSAVEETREERDAAPLKSLVEKEM